MVHSIDRWDAYKERVRRFLDGDDDNDTMTVFGVCVRCGSSRLVVTNKQLRPGFPSVLLYGILAKTRRRRDDGTSNVS